MKKIVLFSLALLLLMATTLGTVAYMTSANVDYSDVILTANNLQVTPMEVECEQICCEVIKSNPEDKVAELSFVNGRHCISYVIVPEYYPEHLKGSCDIVSLKAENYEQALANISEVDSDYYWSYEGKNVSMDEIITLSEEFFKSNGA